jgi:hypothetical protein
MSRSLQFCVLAGAITPADLVVFIHCIPIVCHAWGSNRWVMYAQSVGMVVWADSLWNLLRAATRGLALRRNPVTVPASLLSLPLHAERIRPNV